MDESRSESLTRRRFLASLGTAVGGIVAGCPGQRGGSADDMPVTTPAPVPTPDRSAHPVPSLDGVGCPGVPKLQGDVSRVCGPPSGTDSGFGIVTNPTEDDPGIPSLPRASLTFRFFRDQQTTLSGLKPPWSLQKYVDGRWHTVRPATIRTEDGFLATGGRSQRTWRLTVDNDATARLDPRADTGGVRLDGSVTRVPVAGLGGGVYAFVVAGWADEEEARRPIAVGARFRLRGPPLAFSHTEAVEGVDRSGDTATVDADPGLGDPVTYVLSRTRRAADARQMLPEEAVTNPPVRNLLAAYDPAVEEVVLHTRRHPAYPNPVLGPVTMRDTGFEIRTRSETTAGE